MASGTSQTPSSSASDLTRANNFDICLSFHDDTRYNFTSYLYSTLDGFGLKTFRNLDKETTIPDSKFYIVVISKNYASSPWCLDQLVEIMNHHHTKRSRVIPIFYNIEPSALGSVAAISEDDKTPFVSDRLAIWRSALMGVTNMSGYNASDKKFQADIISNVVDRVLSEINPKVENITKYPVGLDSQVNQIIKLLSSDKKQGAIKFGIYGMGGVGKTTLAKSLYNRLHERFEGSCFLVNFREVLETERGLERLQEKLINDVLNWKNIISIDNADQGFELIRATICSKKVVIVIDDLDDAISLDFILGPLASGSVVIITTSDEEVLDQADVEPMYRYMVNVLNDADSLTLFTKHAFGDATPNDTLMMLSQDIVSHAGGLPLALEAYGSYLSTQPSEILWKEFLHELKKDLGKNNTLFNVFISFYGKDTRSNFTAHLYRALDHHGFRTFKDVPELSTKDKISDTLLHAIECSQTYIVVLSENYVISSWCLDELVVILDCHNRANRLIIPVFYKIDPSVVRHQTGRYGKAFKKHETRFDLEKVNKWRHALTEVSSIAGYLINENRSEAAIIEEIIDEIIDVDPLKVKDKTLNVAKYPVGLDSAVKTVMSSLSGDTHEGLIMFGIHGRGGVGKTTLAKAIYNQLLGGNFKDSSFLENVGENSRSMKGLATLQEQLINDILKSKNRVQIFNVEQGIEIIEARICSTKVLVVIDDLDNIKQFKSLVRSFASGSVVIITTRDEQMLDYIKVEPRYRYKVNELDDVQSRALFTKYAFEDAKVNNSLMESFSDDILRLAGGLPLALEVFGSYLSTQQSHEEWESYIEKLQRNPSNTIQQKLLRSLDAIELEDPMLKQLFLDIACFFIGSKKEEAVKILETYYSFPDYKIDILEKKYLLTLNNNDELTMHDLLRDMGREVARNGFLHDQPENHSRLWVSEDIRNVLTYKMGTEAIECIFHHHLYYSEHEFEEYEEPDEETSLSFTMETFTGMRRLRFLHLQGGFVSGSFINLPENLTWLHWDYCRLTCLPSEYYPQYIVILELRHSKITKWEQKMVFKNLKKIDMSYSLDLVSIPNLDKFPRLKTLYLEGCRNLLHKDMWNIGSLTRLHLGDSIACLQKLVELDLTENNILETLPEIICSLRALCSLSVSYCTNLQSLPDDLGNIESLKKLHVRGLHVSKLPDSIGSLANLVELNLTHNQKLTSLPDTICSLKALEVLRIDECTLLKELPKDLGNMESLKVLSAEGLCITNLPDSIGILHKLVELYLSSNFNLTSLPDSICELTALEILHIDDCRSLKSWPKELGKIQSLRVLSAKFLSVEKLPDSIGDLGKLVELKLCSNIKITTLPNTISKLSSLEILDLSVCEELNILPNELWELPRLRELDASCSPLLKELPDIQPTQISASPLMKLDLSGSGLIRLPVGLNQLSKLQNLDLFGCSDLMSIPELPPNLTSIYVQGCKSMKRLPNVSDMKQLEYLYFTNCSGLMKIQGLEELSSLRGLHLGGCNLSLLETKLTRRIFQLWSGFGNEIKIHTPSAYLPSWISQPPYWISGSGSTVLLELLPNVSHNFLGIILCFQNSGNEMFYQTTYSVKNMKSDFVWRGRFLSKNDEAQIMLVPTSLLVRDGERIEVSANQKIHGIHLLYD